MNSQIVGGFHVQDTQNIILHIYMEEAVPCLFYYIMLTRVRCITPNINISLTPSALKLA